MGWGEKFTLSQLLCKNKNWSTGRYICVLFIYIILKKSMNSFMCRFLTFCTILQQNIKSEMQEFSINKSFHLKDNAFHILQQLIKSDMEELTKIKPFTQSTSKTLMEWHLNECLHFAPSSGIWWQEVKSSSIHLHLHPDVPLCTSPKKDRRKANLRIRVRRS